MERRVILKLMADKLNIDLNEVSKSSTSELEAIAYLAQTKGFNFPYHFYLEDSGRVGSRGIRDDLAGLCSLDYDTSELNLSENSVKILEQVSEVIQENDPVLLASLHFLIFRNQLKSKEKELRINEARERLGEYKRSYFYPELKRAYETLETEGLVK